MNTRTPIWEAWVDGTASPNPGRLGVGLVLVSPGGDRRQQSRSLGRNGCNNEAELRAIGAALTAAGEAGARQLAIHSDSRFAVDCLSGLDTTETPHLAELLATTLATIATFDAVTLSWLPRHRNTEADRLARAALGLAPKAPSARRKRRR